MIEAVIRKLMREAILRFAQKEGVEPSEIFIVIHTKYENFLPQYYYTVNGIPKKDDSGEIIDLSFKKDILSVKWDPMSKEEKAAYFLSEKFKFFEKLYEEDGYKAGNMYLLVRPQDKEMTDFNVDLLHKRTKFIKRFTLAEIFEM